MTPEFIQIYPADAALQTEERKKLHAEILEHFEIGEFKKKTFGPALRRLCFEGKIESLDERILDPGELIRRINPLGTYIHAYLCIASPVVSEEAFVEILQHYKQRSVADMGIDLVRTFDGTRLRHPGPELHSRIRCLVRALPQVIPATLFQELCGDMFSRFLSLACFRGSTENALVTEHWNGVDQFVGLGKEMESIRKLAATLFSGQAEEPRGYQDSQVIQFCELYFQRRLGPNLLALLDTIYHAIPEDHRMRFERGAIVFTHTPTSQASAADETPAPTPSQSAASPGPMGTGFFCLARSPAAAHSHDVESLLAADSHASSVAQAPEVGKLHALMPFVRPETLLRVDETTLLLGWEAEFAPEAGREAATACTAAGCHVLVPALWLESGEVLNIHGLGPGESWRFSRMPHGEDSDDECAEVFEQSELLALLLAKANEESAGKKGMPPQ